jgi:sirohydrochlorin ferrochelatase
VSERSERTNERSTAPPALLAVGHGSRDTRGPATVDRLLGLVAARRPGLLVRAGYLELAAPDLEAALAGLAGHPVVVVPLLLGAGYHVKVDIRDRVPAEIPVAAPLGPHPRLVRAVTDRLRVAGWEPGEPVVLAAAGSADAEAVTATWHTARLLELATGSPVQAAFTAIAGPRVPAAVAALRARYPGQRVTVASYLLAPGTFADTVATAPADLVSAPLGAHAGLADLILRRYDEARAAARPPAPAQPAGRVDYDGVVAGNPSSAAATAGSMSYVTSLSAREIWSGS